MSMYTLWVHWKQGDTLAGHLDIEKDPVRALRNWAADLHAGATHVLALAAAVEASGKPIEIHADTHHIGVDGDPALLDALAGQDLLIMDEGDGEEDEDEYDAELREIRKDETMLQDVLHAVNGAKPPQI